MREQIEQYCINNEIPLFFIDGADSCLIGIGHTNVAHYLIYDKKKYLELLEETMGGEEEALEWFFYNVLGSSLSSGCVFLETL